MRATGGPQAIVISQGEAVLCSQRTRTDPFDVSALRDPAATAVQYIYTVASTKQPRGPIKLRDSYEDLGALSNGRHLHHDGFNGRPLQKYFYYLPHPSFQGPCDLHRSSPPSPRATCHNGATTTCRIRVSNSDFPKYLQVSPGFPDGPRRPLSLSVDQSDSLPTS